MIRDIGLVLLFAAIIALLGLVPNFSQPFLGGVPVTWQSMGVTLAGVLIGSRRGAFAALVFLVAVAIGWPLLAGGRGGLGVFTGPMAGFIIGYVPAAYVTGVLFDHMAGRFSPIVAALVAAFIGGYFVLSLIGVPVLAWITDRSVRSAVDVAVGLLPGGVIKAFGTAVIAYLIAGMDRR